MYGLKQQYKVARVAAGYSIMEQRKIVSNIAQKLF
jgi:hypothetical protein